MKSPNIQTKGSINPMIYAYITPGVSYHDGWTKIGYTEQDVETRIKQQCHTAGIKWHTEWSGRAVFDDTGETFTDKPFHAYLVKLGVEKEPDTEWCLIDGPTSRSRFNDFRSNHGITQTDEDLVVSYRLRDEQDRAVQGTYEYAVMHADGEYLWNAKPRFGKTLSVYDFCKRMGANTVLIVTNRPAIANSWYDDYTKFLGPDSGYWFVSEVDALKGKRGVLTRKEYLDRITPLPKEQKKCIEFVSLQDLKGSIYFGGQFDKLGEITGITWDVLVVDEAHEGVDTYKTDVAFDHIKRRFTLHLSGTPFKALANNKFADDAIFNWTYADEQAAKRDWDESREEENPYLGLPRLNLYTYQMSEIVRDELEQGVEINGETEEYAFDLNEFFSTDGTGKFRYASSVDKFLDALTLQKRFPFSTPELRDEIKHSFWLLDRVDSAKALAKKLKDHPVFKDYCIVLAAGDGKLDDDEETKKSFDKVMQAIAENDKTITLSVGQLTTGVTVPEWTAVLMLSNVKSPSLYMQAAFRAQNPCTFTNGVEYYRKENAYVFDFDPARTLVIFEEFANDLCSTTAAGRGDSESRKANVRELLNFFPVVGEDEDGELIELDAEMVLTIPRKIKSLEVVRRGFMSNFLFQNVANIFGAPKEVRDIIEQFTPVAEPKNPVKLSPETKEALHLDEDGNVSLDDEYVIGQASEVFGEKIYATADDTQSAFVYAFQSSGAAKDATDKALESLKSAVKEAAVKPIVEQAQEHYGSDVMKKSDTKFITKVLDREAEHVIEKAYGNYQIDQKVLEAERSRELQSRFETGKTVEEIDAEYDAQKKAAAEKFEADMSAAISDFVEAAGKDVVRAVETRHKEREKNEIEDGIRANLRGFARTIPSFLMAYGDETVTLATFDEVVPGNVFQEVTSITLEQFRFLRDGGDYIDEETGETKHYEGQLFDSVVFDDSVKEFLALKQKLADYFSEEAVEDIFDYIPPQKTNQIFTPKDMVKKMVDMLEQENPGCFDDDSKTFIDLYMKSGLYIAEIVKRLFQSEAMKAKYPDDEARLKHIFEHQVYGLAPTEIIYNIAISFILGFDEDIKISSHNFVELDALPYAKEGTLKEKLDEIWPDVEG